MKKGILLLTVLFSLLAILPSCNKSNDDNSSQPTQLTLIIEPGLISSGPVSAANYQYQATVEGTGEKLTIPTTDILGFYFVEGNTYTILVDKYQVQINGVPTGEVYYKLVKIISQAPVWNDKEEPTPDPTSKKNKPVDTL